MSLNISRDNYIHLHHFQNCEDQVKTKRTSSVAKDIGQYLEKEYRSTVTIK